MHTYSGCSDTSLCPHYVNRRIAETGFIWLPAHFYKPEIKRQKATSREVFALWKAATKPKKALRKVKKQSASNDNEKNNSEKNNNEKNNNEKNDK